MLAIFMEEITFSFIHHVRAFVHMGAQRLEAPRSHAPTAVLWFDVICMARTRNFSVFHVRERSPWRRRQRQQSGLGRILLSLSQGHSSRKILGPNLIHYCSGSSPHAFLSSRYTGFALSQR